MTDFLMDEPARSTRLDGLSDDVLILIIVLLFKTGNFPALRALGLTSTRFLALLGKNGVGGPTMGPTELPLISHVFDLPRVTKMVKRASEFKWKPWVYLATWNQSALISANFQKCLFAPLAAEAASCGSAVFSTLIPPFLSWIKSFKPLEQKALLIDLRKAVRANDSAETERRRWRILERRIVRAGDVWTPDPAKQNSIRETLDALKVGPLDGSDAEKAAILSGLVIDDLPELPENEVDAAWWSLRNNVTLLRKDVQVEPLFALALCIPCLSESKRITAFKDVEARTKGLVVEDQVVVSEGLVECLDCIPKAVHQPWREWLRDGASTDVLFLPVYGASLKTLEPKEREGQFTKVFEVELPTDPNVRAAWLESLSEWVEYLNSDARSETLEGLVQETLETQNELIPQDVRNTNEKRWESIATHLVCQAHALSANQVAAMVPTYTSLILGARCSKSTVLAALFSTICVPANQHVLGAVFEHVLRTAFPLFPWPKGKKGLDSEAMLKVLEWIKCQRVVAGFLRCLPEKSFESVSTLLLSRLEDVVQRLQQWRDDEFAQRLFHQDSKLMLPVHEAMVDLLRCVSPLAKPSAALGAYLKKLLELGLSARHGAVPFYDELVEAFANRTHLLPAEDQLSLIDFLIDVHGEPTLLPTICASGVQLASVDDRASLCARIIKKYRGFRAFDPEELSALRTTLWQLIETLPEPVAAPLREEHARLTQPLAGDSVSASDSGEEDDVSDTSEEDNDGYEKSN